VKPGEGSGSSRALPMTSTINCIDKSSDQCQPQKDNWLDLTLLDWHHGAHLIEEARIICMDLEGEKHCTPC